MQRSLGCSRARQAAAVCVLDVTSTVTLQLPALQGALAKSFGLYAAFMQDNGVPVPAGIPRPPRSRARPRCGAPPSTPITPQQRRRWRCAALFVIVIYGGMSSVLERVCRADG